MGWVGRGKALVYHAASAPFRGDMREDRSGVEGRRPDPAVRRETLHHALIAAPTNRTMRPNCPETAATVRAKPIRDFLQAGSGVGDLIPQAEKLLALREAVAPMLPANLRSAAQVANLKAQVLLLQASNNAVAAKLKHYAPRLVSGLADQGYHVTQIKIEVQPDAGTSSASPRKARLVPDAASQALTRLEDTLPEGPLRDAVRALANKTR